MAHSDAQDASLGIVQADLASRTGGVDVAELTRSATVPEGLAAGLLPADEIDHSAETSDQPQGIRRVLGGIAVKSLFVGAATAVLTASTYDESTVSMGAGFVAGTAIGEGARRGLNRVNNRQGT